MWEGRGVFTSLGVFGCVLEGCECCFGHLEEGRLEVILAVDLIRHVT